MTPNLQLLIAPAYSIPSHLAPYQLQIRLPPTSAIPLFSLSYYQTHTMHIVHIVLFEFKPSVELDVILDVCHVAHHLAVSYPPSSLSLSQQASRDMNLGGFTLGWIGGLMGIGLQTHASPPPELHPPYDQRTIYARFEWGEGYFA